MNASLVSGLNNPFGMAVAKPYTAQVQQPINPDGSSVFSVRRLRLRERIGSGNNQNKATFVEDSRVRHLHRK
jgi:hypothetical protein